jgi:hypothetical protein
MGSEATYTTELVMAIVSEITSGRISVALVLGLAMGKWEASLSSRCRIWRILFN